MNPNNSKYHKLTLCLVVICLLMAALIMHLLTEQDTVETAGVVASKKAQVSSAEVSPLAAVEGEQGDYLEFVNRPMFTENRRPPRVVVDTGEKKKTDPNLAAIKPAWELMGTVVTAGTRYALFWNPQGQAMLRLKQGATMDGWEISEIKDKQVEITREGQVHNYVLPEFNQEN